MSEKDGGAAASGFDPAKVAQAQLEDLKIQEEKSKINQEILKTIGDQLGSAKELIEIERIRLNESIKFLKSVKDTENALEQIADKGGEIYSEFEKILQVSSLTSDQQDEIVQLLDGTVNGLNAAIEKLTAFRVQQEKSKEFAEDLSSETSKLARNMGIAAEFSKTTVGHFVKLGQDFLAGDRTANMKAIYGAINGMVSPMNILASLFDIAVKKMIALDKAAVGLRVATGFARDFQGEMAAVAASSAQVGVSLDVSNEAFSSVVKTIKGINQESPQFIANLGESAAKMTKLGVSAQTSAKNFDLLIKSFKMTDAQATSMMESMAAKASDLGLTAEEMGAEFNSAMGYLSSFGKEGIKAFEDLASQAGVTGLAISKMLDMTKAFDKFSEGAKKAATLNSVLGTSLSSMALMTMNPAQRMTELRNQINAATGGVKNMTQAQKLFTAEAMGYSSVAEMMADLQASPADLRERAELAERQAKIQERLANAMTELLPLTERVSMAFEKLATNEKLIRTLGIVIEGLVEVVAFFVSKPGAVLLVLLSTLKLRLMATKLAADATGISLRAMGGPIIQAGFAFAMLAATVDDPILRTGLFAIAGGLIALGFAAQFTASRGALGAIVTVFSLLAGLLGTRINPLFIQFGFFMAAGILAMGIAAKVGGPSLTLLAVAFALLAGGVALVFYGMSALVESITGLFTTMSQSVDTMPAIVLGIFALGAAFLFLGYAASFSSMGIFMGLGALTAMLLLFKLTGTSMATLFGAGNEIMKIGTGIEKFGQGLGNISSAVGAIKSSLGDKGLFAGSVSGDSTSMILGDGVAVAKLFKNSKIEVDVKMPEISMPKVDVKVFIGNEELRDIIRKEITRGQK